MDDDDDSWIPLEHPIESSQQPSTDAISTAVLSSSSSSRPEASPSSSVQAQVRPGRKGVSGNNNPKLPPSSAGSILALQRRVEMRQHLKQRLVHHPIQLLWSHFLWHLAREFWSLDSQIRVALVLIVVGAVAKVSCWMTWYFWYPRTIITIGLFLGGWLFLDPRGIPRRIQSFFEALVALPNRIPETLEQLDPQRARLICVISLFFPTVLQMRTISFLADVNATGAGWKWNGLVTLLLAGVCTFFLRITQHAKAPRDISQRCLLLLYATALWIAIQQWNIMTMPHLVGPFCLSTGTLLLSYDVHDNMEWFSRMIRRALRLTLRDVLATVGNSVQEDEMLQLAMLRWIVDYWSYTPASPQTTHDNSNSRPAAAAATSATTQTRGQELQWDQLLPMLNVATDQMTEEVHVLQQARPTTSSSFGSMSNATRRQGTSANSSTTSSSTAADYSLHNFQMMLASMNVDDRAQPAVAAYRRNVEQFPPTQKLALIVSITRRCPASLVFLWQLLIASMFQSYSTTFCIFCLLTPLIVLEVLCIRAWIQTCNSLSQVFDANQADPPRNSQRQSTERSASVDREPRSAILANADPMTILLSGDDDTIFTTVAASGTNDNDGEATCVTTKVTIPTLLLVWRNIESSVGALEVSLTAARCVQTGAVAIDFTKNIMSLAKFGVEVSQHGWMYGLTVIIREVIRQHDTDETSSTRETQTTYTHAAVNAVQNGQRVAHNLRILAAEDTNTSRVLDPIVGFFGFIGDFFRHGDNRESTEDSTVQEDTETPDHKQDESQERSARWDNLRAITDEHSQGEESKPSVAEKAQGFSNEADDVDVTSTKGEWKSLSAGGENHDVPEIALQGGTETEISAAICKTTKTQTQNVILVPTWKEPGHILQPDTVEAEHGKESILQVNNEPGRKQRSNAAENYAEAGTVSPCGDLAEVMDLIAEAFEKDLIDESEKNEFCLKLSTNNESDVVAGMKKTLQGLMLETSHEQLDHSSPPGSEAPKLCQQGGTIGEQQAKEEDAWSPIVPSVASQEDMAVQALDYSDRVANAVNSNETLTRPQLSRCEDVAASENDSIPTVESSAPARRRENEEENVWVKVGGSVAVVGAIVGGAFLAMNHGNDNDRNIREHEENRNSVRIERLDEEEEENGNEWESTGGEATTQAQ